jgi:DGQHR domain-containing protein
MFIYAGLEGYGMKSSNLEANTSKQIQTVRLQGVEATQHGRRILVGKIGAKDLSLLFEKRVIRVDEFSASNPDGYQRSLMKTRSRRFGRYISGEENICPTSLLLYVRDPKLFPENSGNGNYMIQTEAPKGGEALLYIADGQHRTDGFAEAIREGWLESTEDFDVPVTILFWDQDSSSAPDPRFEEASQFFTINQEQRRMRTDLAHQYLFRRKQHEKGLIGDATPLGRMKKKEYTPYKVAIARRLQTDPDSPFYGKISMPNTNTGLVNEGTFTDSMAAVMDYAVTAGLNVGQTLNLLKNYWRAVFKLCPDAVARPQDSLLIKTAGIYTLHMVLPMLMVRRPHLGTQPSAEQLQHELEGVGECFTDQFWDSDTGEARSFGGGYKAFRDLADHVLEFIQVS